MRVSTLNAYWFGLSAAAHAHLAGDVFQREPGDEGRFAALVASLDADLIAFEEIVDLAALEALLHGVDPSWTLRDANGEFVSNPGAEMLHVVWAWRSDRVDMLAWTRLPRPTNIAHSGGVRAPVAAVFRHRDSAMELTCVALHAKSGNPRRTSVPDADAEVRAKQLATLRAWIESVPAEFARPLRLVAGDFNSLADSPEMRELVTASMAEWSILAPSFVPASARVESTRTDSGCVIDHFVVSPELRAVITAPPVVYAFDEDPAFFGDPAPPSPLWKRTTDHRPVTLTVSSERSAQREEPGALSLTLLSTTDLPLKDLSGVVALADGTLLFAQDDEGVYRWRADSGCELLRGKEDHAALRDIESLAYDEATKRLYTVSEEEGVLLEFDVLEGAETTLSPPRERGRLERLGLEENKGWEGLAVLPARFRADGVTRLIAAYEKAPKAIAVFSLPGVERIAKVELDGELDHVLGDLSDVAVCPDTGRLMLLSDASETLAEVELSADDSALRLISHIELPVADHSKPEGVAVTSDRQLLIVTDATRQLLRFSMSR